VGYDGVGVLSGAGGLEAREEANELEGLGELLEGRLEGLGPLRLRGRDQNALDLPPRKVVLQALERRQNFLWWWWWLLVLLPLPELLELR
jgi:hypothetical protein